MKTKMQFKDLKQEPVRTKVVELIGYWVCLNHYGIWKNGTRVIGCMEIPIQEAMGNEIARWFISDDVDVVMDEILEHRA